ncbi:MAG: carboxypeptidase regulatory-like domain-containing protein [Candidatus Kerfeldbacteria bacterium]|nr:carboxypeptidase regulatory-like domain-containing protein [Candidatus Kerfeldbacteria bacterium]
MVPTVGDGISRTLISGVRTFFIRLKMQTMSRRFVPVLFVAAVLLFIGVHRADAVTSVTGKLTQPDGTTAVSNAWVVTRDNTWTVYQGRYTASDGAFSFSDLPTCSCTLEVYANNLDNADPDPLPISVVSGETLNVGTQKLVPHNVTGILYGPDGTTAMPSIGISLQSSDYSIYRWYTTTSSGVFRFRVPSAGQYTLRVSGNYTSGSTTYYAPPDMTVTVTDPATALNLGSVLMKNPNVTGKITEPNGTTGINAAYVNAHNATWTAYRYSVTTSDGSFGFYLPSGNYTMETWAQNDTYNSPDPVTFTVTEGQTTALGAVKMLAPNVFFKLTLGDGTTPVANAGISIHTPNWGINRYRSTKSDGTAGITLTTAATYKVEVWAYNSTESNPDPFTFTYSSGNIYYDGTNGSEVIRMQAPSARGSVKRPDGTAARSASLYLTSTTGATSQWASTETDGTFTLPSVPTGTYTLRVTPPWDATGLIGPDDLTLNLTKGTTNTTYQTTPIVLGQAMKTITGRVTKPNGTPVTDGYISAWKPAGFGWAQATTNANGEFSMLVGSGSWSVSVWPSWSGGAPTWNYYKQPTAISFTQSNSVAESATVNFTVQAFTATITGTIRTPDDGFPTGYNSISLSSKDGIYNWAQVGVNGAFSVKVAPATYNIDIYSSSNQYASPEVAPISIADGETRDLGTLKFVTKNEFIKGKVVDSNGNGIANQSVSTWKVRGNGWAWTQTDSNGNFSLTVSPGAWKVDAYPSYYGYGQGTNTTQYTRTQDPQQVSVNTNETIENVNFTFAIADATIAGVVKGEDGNTLNDLYGWLDIRNANTTPGASSTWTGLGGEVSQGKFSVKVPAGTYALGVWMSYQSNYTATTETPITVASGGNVTDAVISLIANDVTVSGTLRDTAGNAVTDISGSIFATNGTSGYQWSAISQGTYSLKLSRGTWRIGYWIDPRSGYLAQPLGTDNELALKKGETRTFDLTLQKLDSTISGKVYDPDGNPLPNAWISVDTEFGGQKSSSDIYDHYGGFFNRGNVTNANGEFSIDVPRGEYFVTVTMPSSFGYINPSVQKILVAPTSPATLEFRFRKSDATISGTTTIGDTTSLRLFRALTRQNSPAYVSAWSEEGGFADIYTNTGDYTLNVTKGDAWHVSAVYETTSNFYHSDEYIITVGESGVATQDLPMSLSSITLPAAVTATFPSNITKVIQLDDGTTLTIPANSLSSTTVDVTVTATPKAQLPNQANAKVFSIGYDLVAKYASGDNNGQTISSFIQDVTISLPYTDERLAEVDLTAAELKPMFWDSTAGSWKTVTNVVLDEENNRISFTTNHFTSFGLITTSSSAVSPILTLTAPEDGTRVTTKRLTTSGTVTDPSATVTVTLNDGAARQVTVDSTGAFSVTLTSLAVGSNTIVVSAQNSTGAAQPVTRTATYTRAQKLTTANRIVATVAGRGGPQVIVADRDGTIRTNFFAYSSKLRMTLQTIVTDLQDDGSEEIITVPGPGFGPQIRIFGIDGRALGSFYAYAKGFTKGMNVVVADLNGDGNKEIITAPRSGGAPHIKIFNPEGRLLGSFLGWSREFRGGLNLATGDIDGDQQAELIVTAQTNGSPAVRIYESTGRLLGSFFAFPKSLRGGFTVITADTDGDSIDEIVATPTSGNYGPQVRVFNGNGRLMTSFFALPKSFSDSLNLSAGDLTGDGKEEIVASAARDGGPIIRAFDSKGNVVTSFFAFKKTYRGGFSTVTTDLDNDGYAEIIVTPGEGFGPQVNIYNRRAQLISSFLTHTKGFRGGLNVSVNN